MQNTNAITAFNNEVTMIRNAIPKISQDLDERGHNVLVLECEDFTHTFPHTSAVSEALSHYPVDRIAQRFNNGTLLFKGDALMDYRYGDYNGMIHTDDSIRALIEHVGAKPNTKGGFPTLASDRKGLDVHLAKHIAGAGGESLITVNFEWSPFQTHISSFVDFMRMVCENGAMICTPILQNKVPVINDWKHHIDIAHTMLMNRTVDLMEKRTIQMINQQAPLSLVMNVINHASHRLEKTEFLTNGQRQILQGVLNACDVVRHSNGIITMDDLEMVDKSWSDRMPTHMSLYSLFNCITEIGTHTEHIDGSSANGVRKLTNGILFHDSMQVYDRIKMNSPFNDPTTALMHHLM